MHVSRLFMTWNSNKTRPAGRLVACQYRRRWVSGNRNIIRALGIVWYWIYSDEEYGNGKCIKLTLWWLITICSGVSKFSYQFVPFYRRQFATNIFSISLGWQWKAGSIDNPTRSIVNSTSIPFSQGQPPRLPASSFSVKFSKTDTRHWVWSNSGGSFFFILLLIWIH